MFWKTEFCKSFPKHFLFPLIINDLIFFNNKKVVQKIQLSTLFITFAMSKIR